MSAHDRLRTDGFITGKMSYGSVPQENWDAIFPEPQNTALKQAERAYAQEDPITATGKPKRVLTPEQKAAAAERMAKARAARKLNLEKPSTAQVEQPQPTPVVEEVTE